MNSRKSDEYKDENFEKYVENKGLDILQLVWEKFAVSEVKWDRYAPTEVMEIIEDQIPNILEFGIKDLKNPFKLISNAQNEIVLGEVADPAVVDTHNLPKEAWINLDGLPEDAQKQLEIAKNFYSIGYEGFNDKNRQLLAGIRYFMPLVKQLCQIYELHARDEFQNHRTLLQSKEGKIACDKWMEIINFLRETEGLPANTVFEDMRAKKMIADTMEWGVTVKGCDAVVRLLDKLALDIEKAISGKRAK